MSWEEQGCNTKSDLLVNIAPCTSSDGPVTADGGLAPTNFGPTKSLSSMEISPAAFINDSTLDSGVTKSACLNSTTISSTTNEGSSTPNDDSNVAADGSAQATNSSAQGIDGSATTTDGTRVRRFATWQLSLLEREFQYCNNPKLDRRTIIASEVKLTEEQVKNWFRRRRKTKQKMEKETRNLTVQSPPSLPLTPSFHESTKNFFPSMNSELCDQDSERIHHWIQSGYQFPVGALREGGLREQPFTMNFYRPVDQSQDTVPRQQMPDAQPVRRHRFRSPINQNPNHDQLPGQEIKIGADGQREYPQGVDNQREFVHSYYRPVDQFHDRIPRQQMPDAQPVRRHRSRFPVNQNSSHEQLPGQEIKIRADGQREDSHSVDNQRDFVHSYYRPVDQFHERVPRQQMPDGQPVRRHRFHSPINQNSSHDLLARQKIQIGTNAQREAPHGEDDQRELAHSYYRPVDQFHDRVPRQQMVQPLRRHCSNFPVNQNPSHDQLPGQEIKIGAYGQIEAPRGEDDQRELVHSLYRPTMPDLFR